MKSTGICSSYMVDAFAGRDSQSIRERWRIAADFISVDVVPDRKDNFYTIDFARNEPIKFSLRPILLQKVGTDYDNSIP